MAQLKRLRIQGWKSIADASVDFGRVNVLIGANGAGKSNIVRFFRLLSCLFNGRFAFEVSKQGGAESVMRFGPKHTTHVTTELNFDADGTAVRYSFEMAPYLGSRLVVGPERVDYLIPGGTWTQAFASQASNSVGSSLDDAPKLSSVASEVIHSLLDVRTFNFHDTSDASPPRRECRVDDNRQLYLDAGNLPAMLYLYRERYPVVALW